MKIIISKEIGFCSGVRRAIKMAFDICEKNEKVFSIGEIVHNETVMSDFPQIFVSNEKAISSVNNEDFPVLLRAHGVTKEFENKISNKYSKVIDLTCPIVYNVFGLVEKYSFSGYDILIYGKKDHPEVRAILSRAKRGYVFQKTGEFEEILENFNKDSMVALISQTTMNSKNYGYYKNILSEKKFKDVQLFDTICDVTVKREEAVEELIEKCDAIVVIGGKKSSNTRKLYEIVIKSGVKGYLIQKPEQLNLSEKIETLGIISGTSTPEKQIDEILNYINESV
jgi:(E)-4-hydroxy-3-methyl-but-2-enyl pyrophosphate reductase